MKKTKGTIPIWNLFCSIWIAGCVILILYLLYRYIQYAQNNQNAQNSQTDVQESPPVRVPSADDTGASVAIRIQILGDQYLTPMHEKITISCSAPWKLSFYSQSEQTLLRTQPKNADECCSFCAEDFPLHTYAVAEAEEGQPFRLPDLKRASQNLQYSGTLFLYPKDNQLLLVNETDLESYLVGVIASEMPSSYPEEAQKAQAVCARTYAWNAIQSQKNENTLADLDDSTSFQVYNNQETSPAAVQAAADTAGEILPVDPLWYYSTACSIRQDSDLDLSDSDQFLSLLKEESADGAEYHSPWVRWETAIDKQHILNQLELPIQPHDAAEFEFEITKRTASGQAEELQILHGEIVDTITGEYEIRSILAPNEHALTLQNDQEISNMTLLPSAWFAIDDTVSDLEVLHLIGSGYGHGLGMSQYGAAAMAAEGFQYRDILKHYYGESELIYVQDQ